MLNRARLLLAFLLAVAAGSAVAGGLSLITANDYNFTDCASGGSVAQTLEKGSYIMRVMDSDTTICFASSASTCATGGQKWPVGTVIHLRIDARLVSVSCRSSASTGDVGFVGAD